MLGAFVNSWKVPELKKRIIYTFLVVAVCRIIANTPVPGIDLQGLSAFFESKKAGAAGGLLGVMDMFSGGALMQFAVGALGVMPYISASIIMQILTPVLPQLEALQREGESGRQTITQYTRYLTLVICLLQGIIIAKTMQSQVVMNGTHILPQGIPFIINTVVVLTAGTMILMWLGEKITERGIGNGVSIIITINIVSRLPQALDSLGQMFTTGSVTLIHIVFLIAIFLGVTAFAVILNQGMRLVPIRHAARATGNASAAAQTTYLPLRVNFSGVMPLIFAGMVIGGLSFIFAKWAPALFAYGSWTYIVVDVILICAFSFFWVGSMFNPMRMADELKRSGAYIPGIRPGKATAEHLDHIMTHITVIAALSLSLLSVIPALMASGIIPGNNQYLAQFFGGSTLLIVVGVTLDIVRQLESQLVAKNYDGFLKKGRIRQSSVN